MLGQRRWTNIKPTMAQCPVFAGVQIFINCNITIQFDFIRLNFSKSFFCAVLALGWVSPKLRCCFMTGVNAWLHDFCRHLPLKICMFITFVWYYYVRLEGPKADELRLIGFNHWNKDRGSVSDMNTVDTNYFLQLTPVTPGDTERVDVSAMVSLMHWQ